MKKLEKSLSSVHLHPKEQTALDKRLPPSDPVSELSNCVVVKIKWKKICRWSNTGDQRWGHYIQHSREWSGEIIKGQSGASKHKILMQRNKINLGKRTVCDTVIGSICTFAKTCIVSVCFLTKKAFSWHVCASTLQNLHLITSYNNWYTKTFACFTAECFNRRQHLCPSEYRQD